MSEPQTPSADVTAPALTRRQALAVGGTLATAAAVGVASAAPAAARSGRGGDPQTLLSVSAEQAERIVEAAEKEAERLGVPMLILVVDACGDVKVSHRMDGNGRASLQLGPPKAQTALDFRTATVDLAAGVAGDPVRQQAFFAAGYTLLGGGRPIRVDGQVIGAVAVGGGTPEQDDQVARAGLAAVGS